MATTLGRAKFEDIKKDAILFLVEGFKMSEDIIAFQVTKPYGREDAKGKPFEETFEWFEGVLLNGLDRTKEECSYHHADVGVDTPHQKAEYNHTPLYPEAMNLLFRNEWFAMQYVRKLKRLYPDRKPGSYPEDSFEARSKAEEEESAKDETFALRA